MTGRKVYKEEDEIRIIRCRRIHFWMIHRDFAEDSPREKEEDDHAVDALWKIDE